MVAFTEIYNETHRFNDGIVDIPVSFEGNVLAVEVDVKTEYQLAGLTIGYLYLTTGLATKGYALRSGKEIIGLELDATDSIQFVPTSYLNDSYQLILNYTNNGTVGNGSNTVGIPSSITGLVSRVGTIEGDVIGLLTWKDGLSLDWSSISGKPTTFSSDITHVADLGSNLDGLHTDVSSLTTSLSTLSTDLNTRVSALETLETTETSTSIDYAKKLLSRAILYIPEVTDIIRGAIPSGSANATTTKVGKRCLSYTGSQNSALSVRVNEILSSLPKFTICFWQNVSSFSYGLAFASWNSVSVSDGQLLFINNTGTSPAQISFLAANGSSAYEVDLPSGVVSTDSWHLFALEVDRINHKIRLGLDSNAWVEASIPSDFVLNTGVETFSLGGYNLADNTITNFHGYIDQFLVTTDNLSDVERAYLYNSGTGVSLI